MPTNNKVAVVLGTRPEIIKLAEIINILGDRAILIHTGQHWDHEMSGTFISDLGIKEPEASLAIGGQTRGTQIAQTVLALDELLPKLAPAAVMVQGDTNTVVGGALSANALDIPLVHVEAGLRSFDRNMPEEHNRVVTDHLSDLCLAPTETSRGLLRAESISDDRISVTGNTIVGAVTRAIASGKESARLTMKDLGVSEGEFIVATIHRPENTDTAAQLERTLGSLARLGTDHPVVIPLHPRTRARVEHFGLTSLLDDLTIVPPLSYDIFVALCAAAALTISDSGGVQEEASVWKKPVIVVRRSTERPEALGTFAQLSDAGDSLIESALDIYDRRDALASELAELPSPFGDLNAAQRCVDATDELIHSRTDGSPTRRA